MCSATAGATRVQVRGIKYFLLYYCVLISDWAHLCLRGTLPFVIALGTHPKAIPQKIRTEFVWPLPSR